MLHVPTETLRQAAAAAKARIIDLNFSFDGVPVHCKLTTCPGATALVVMLHGAVDLKTRTPPIFTRPGRDLAASAHCLAIADPSLRPGLNINIAWYAGDQHFDSPARLTQVVAAVAEALGVRRRIYQGTSGGGFGALLLSHGDPGSVAVVGNPQVNIETYHGMAARNYRREAWPDLAPGAPLSEVAPSNLCQLYAGGFDNTVIYVQSLGDRHHFERHALPFIAAIASSGRAKQFHFHADYWGHMGHVPVPHEYVLWIKAAGLADDTSPETLLTLHHQLKAAATAAAATPAPKSAAAATDGAGFSATDLQISALLVGLRKARAQKQGASK